MVDGIPVDRCIDMDVKIRERISELLMRLILLELFEFRYMQTDPNWSNFFYNLNTKQVLRLQRLFAILMNTMNICNFNQEF